MLAQVGAVAYKLLLSAEASIHPIFHVSQLRRAIGTAYVVSEIPPQLLDDLELQVEPELELGVCPSQDFQEPGFEVLIKWKGLSEMEAT